VAEEPAFPQQRGDDPDISLSPERFETILSSVSDGVFAVDSSWRITCFNRAASATLGISREEALGRPCHEVLNSDICPDACALRYTMETGRPIVDMLIHLRGPGGRRIPVTISTALIRDAGGRIVGGVETFRNLNHVKRMLSQVERTNPFEDFVSCNPAIERMFGLLPTIAGSGSSVLSGGRPGPARACSPGSSTTSARAGTGRW
jgi:PAS domain S-box-containing protein